MGKRLRSLLWRAWNGLTMLSLGLFAAVCVLWVGSYWYGENYLRVGGDSARDFYVLHMEPGGVTLRRVLYVDPGTGQLVVSSPAAMPIPYLWPVLLFAAPPAARLMHWCAGQRRRRLRLGLCPSCGYDLRATPGRCPECGTTVAKGVTP